MKLISLLTVFATIFVTINASFETELNLAQTVFDLIEPIADI